MAAVPLVIGAGVMPRVAFAAPSAPPLRFLVIGDWGRQGSSAQKAVARLSEQVFAEKKCSFVVTTGDNFYIWGVPSGALQPWRVSYEDVYAPTLKRNWLATLGNHDYSGDVEAQIRYRSAATQAGGTGLPAWGWRMDDRWWQLRLSEFGRPDVHLFFIDTVTWEGGESFPHNLFGDHVRFGDHEAQRKWLVDNLCASDARFKFVIGHHPIYSVGEHGGRPQKLDLDCILRRGGVTAYIHGHDHCLYYIRNQGMDYVCSGAGSAISHKFTGLPNKCVVPGNCPDANHQDRTAWLKYLDMGGVAIFSVHGDRVEFEFRTVDGGISGPWPIPMRMAV